ncbi:MazG family protein [Tsukamurella sp. 8F]|uniref:MazG family protein n=1 Tax=unclassified Tsukamurella TaxID=2633480 RepID=UPI0023BA252A|nr:MULTISPECIES: MazG family protein [unclassified Tsukamurella]MDF0530234.1 MazG family protein [Tsukamurella sp. 8J]MDF0586551.1 MazG family protein [Tsukamurella sp. 8F]
MTVIRLNAALPTLLPVEALPHLGGAVYYTEELPVRLAWNMPGAQPLFGPTVEPDAAVLTTDVDHPDVAALLRGGHRLVAAPAPAGLAVLDTVALIDRLRTEGPWESRQTHASLLRFLIEETYELVDAVQRLGDAAPGSAAAAAAQDGLRSELGDLLLQVVFQTRIAQDEPDHPFDVDDVARTLTEKVRRRTPHLGSGATIDVATQAANWERQKAAEREHDADRGDEAPSCLDGIVVAQPALALAQKVFERLRTAGFPAELVPDDVRSLRIDPADEFAFPEVTYRTAVLRLMDRVRSAEQLMQSGVAEDWAAAWAGPGGAQAEPGTSQGGSGVDSGNAESAGDDSMSETGDPDSPDDTAAERTDGRSKKKSSKKK